MNTLRKGNLFAISFFLFIGILVVCLGIAISQSSATSLVVTESRHLFGGEISLATDNHGAYSIPVARAENHSAAIFFDYAPPQGGGGLFLILVDENRNLTLPPIRLADRWAYSKVLWDGTAYICLVVTKDGLVMKRFYPNGTLELEVNIPMPGDRYSDFEAFLEEGVIHIIRQAGTDHAFWADFSTNGERLSHEIDITLAGVMEHVAFLKDTIAVLSNGWNPVNYIDEETYLQIYDRLGNQVGNGSVLPGFAYTPFRAFCWNGTNFLCIGAREQPDMGESILVFRFDRQGQVIGEPIEIGYIPPEIYYGTPVSTTELLQAGKNLLAVWDQRMTDGQENIYARLLDEDGIPLTTPLKVNSEPLNYVNHGTYFTGDEFQMFSVEQGTRNPSVVLTRIRVDETAPPPENRVVLTVSGNLPSTEAVSIRVKGYTTSLRSEDGFPETWDVVSEFSGFLPEYSVEVTGRVLDGPGCIVHIDQPRPWNNFTATVHFEREESHLEGVTRIELTWGEEIPPGATSTPAPTPTPTLTPTPVGPDGPLNFKAYVDGADLLHVQGNRAWIENLKYNTPTEIFVNQMIWRPVWDGETSLVFDQLYPPLPGAGFYVYMTSAKGRGLVQLAQIPDAWNGYEAIIFLNDKDYGSAAWYEFSLAWTDVPPPTPTPPAGNNYLTWRGIIGDFGVNLLEIQGDQVFLYGPASLHPVTILSKFSNPLPGYPVNIAANHTIGDATVAILEQPRASNDYTARVTLETMGMSDIYQEIVFTWGGRIQPEPTPTPWPTWNPVAPTPTPIEDAPQVFWIVMERAFPSDGQGYGYDFVEFADMFTQLGAENRHVLVGSQTITDDLLQGYAAVIFGDTRDTSPLSEAEQETVVRFVRRGGSIFVIGQQDLDYILEPPAIYASSVTEPFGLRFSTQVRGTFSDFTDHPITKEVEQVWGRGSRLLVEPPAEAVGWSRDGQEILAVAEDGYGRVVAFGDEVTFCSGDAPMINGYSHRQLATNIAKWLLHKEDEQPVLVDEWEIY